MSNQVIWQIVRKNSCFLTKQQHGDNIVCFASDKGNASNVYSRRTLSLCNSKLASVEQDGKKCVLIVKSAKENANNVKVNTQNIKRSIKRARKAIKDQVTFVRPSLEAICQKRYAILRRAIVRSANNYEDKKSRMGRRGASKQLKSAISRVATHSYCSGV